VKRLANAVVEEAVGEARAEDHGERSADKVDNPAAAVLGRLGGKNGGEARAKKLTKHQLAATTRKATLARLERG